MTVGNVLLILWLATWIVSAILIGRRSKSLTTVIGGGLLTSIIAILIVSLAKSTADAILYPNPAVKDWEASQPKPQQDFWKEDSGEAKTIFDNDKTRPGIVVVSSLDYGDRWPFTVRSGELECVDNAVILHTSKGTYSVNGKAMDRFAGILPEWREIAKPYPGLESDPSARMPPPNDLIQRGLALCR